MLVEPADPGRLGWQVTSNGAPTPIVIFAISGSEPTGAPYEQAAMETISACVYTP